MQTEPVQKPDDTYLAKILFFFMNEDTVDLEAAGR